MGDWRKVPLLESLGGGCFLLFRFCFWFVCFVFVLLLDWFWCCSDFLFFRVSSFVCFFGVVVCYCLFCLFVLECFCCLFCVFLLCFWGLCLFCSL